MEKRPIKFRARKRYGSEWKTIPSFEMDGIGNEFYSGAIEKHNDPDEEYILMEFTGLKDRNDIEIYEDDFVKSKFGDDVYKIAWMAPTFVLLFDKKTNGNHEYGWMRMPEKMNDYEVVILPLV